MQPWDAERFVRDHDRALARLLQDVQALGHDGASLDRSYASLDRIEDVLRERLDANASDKTFEAHLAMYVGAVLVERTSGLWELPRAKEDLGQPFIRASSSTRVGRSSTT